MAFLDKFFGESEPEFIADGPFTVQMIFECDLVLQNKSKLTAAVDEFLGKFPSHIAASPKITQASDGNIIELTLLCSGKEEILRMNRELEIIAERYGLR